MRLLLTILILILFNPVAAIADSSLEKMMKITFYDATPGQKTYFATLPKTLYRLGPHHARLEAKPDREHGVHELVVVNGRDTWMVNLAVKRGRHIVDTAESYDFHAPIIGGHDSPFAGFEFGRELAYMEQQGIQPTPVRVTNLDLLQYEISEGPTTVRLLVDPKTRRPWGVDVIESDQILYQLRYREYLTGLDPEMSLFTRPAGITYEDTGLTVKSP